MTAPYNGLRKATITVRPDGLLDVVRERDTGNGERITGCATLDEALEAIRAHAHAWRIADASSTVTTTEKG